MDNPLEALEKWRNGHKSRSVSISIDSGYGATCWEVDLRGNGKHAVGLECSFVGKQSDAPPYIAFPADQDADDWDWPGLGPTIMAALRKAEELGL